MASGSTITAGIDLGGTYVRAGLVDSAGKLLASLRGPTDATSPDSVIESANAVLAALLDHDTTLKIAGIGIGVAGRVDVDAGTVSQALNLGLGERAVPLADALEDRFDVPTCVENDVNAAAVGAYHAVPDDRRRRSIAYLSLGTGVAAGLILNRRLFRGTRGLAGEIGHIPVDPAGVRCACGSYGCLETVASGAALARWWPSEAENRSAGELFRHAATEDPDAQSIVERFAAAVGLAVQMLALTYDVDEVLIGGGVTEVGRPLFNAVDRALALSAADSGFVTSLGLRERVRPAPPGLLGVLGAAWLAREIAVDVPAGNGSGRAKVPVPIV